MQSAGIGKDPCVKLSLNVDHCLSSMFLEKGVAGSWVVAGYQAAKPTIFKFT